MVETSTENKCENLHAKEEFEHSIKVYTKKFPIYFFRFCYIHVPAIFKHDMPLSDGNEYSETWTKLF